MIYIWIKWTLERGYKSVEVMEGSWGCTWGAPKCTKMVTIAWYSKLFWIFPEWLMWSFLILDGHFKGYRSQHKSWWSHGVKHEGHENAPKSTKIHKNSHHSMIEHTVPNLSWVTSNAIFFFIFLKKNLSFFIYHCHCVILICHHEWQKKDSKSWRVPHFNLRLLWL